MSTGLTFEVAAPPPTAAPNRTDIACFIGFVARRSEVPLPESVQPQLRESGWLDGPWRRSQEALESALQLPIAVDSWNEFDRLFAWDARPVRAGSEARCATYLGAAVRSFFARGGRRAVIVRTGDPWPYFNGARAARRSERIRSLIPGFLDPAELAAPRSFDRLDPRTWVGLEHVYGLPDVTLVVIPDICDACATEAPPPSGARTPAVPPEGFVECSDDEPVPPEDRGLARMAAPRCDRDGYVAWQRAALAMRSFLAAQRRDCLFVGALPLPHANASQSAAGVAIYAEREYLSFLRSIEVFEAAHATQASPTFAATAFIQLGWPWLSTQRSADLPETLEPPDGVLAGVIAAAALARGTFRSVAGTRLTDVLTVTPLPAWGEGPASPTAELAKRVCLFAPEPDGWTLVSDVTTSRDPSWRSGGASRLVASVLRAARRIGEGQLFQPNGPTLWGQLRRAMEDLLTDYWRAGGLQGTSADQAFEVRCDRSTMSQNDLDNGRLVAQVTLAPVAAIEHITFVLAIQTGAATAELRGVA